MLKNLENIIISQKDSIRNAMKQINSNTKGVVFVVDSFNKLCGVITDGDIRRALLNNATLEDKVTVAMNSRFVSFHESTPFEEIIKKIGYKFKCIPILNSEGEIVDHYFLDFKSYIPIAKPSLEGNELKYVTECIRTNWISSQGKYVESFEKKFAEFIGVKYGVATSNGTVALHLALATLGVKEGDEVAVPSLTFVATANAVKYCGATPVFIDSEMDTWGMDPEDLERKITCKTKAVIPVHLYGQPAKMKAIKKIAKRYKLFVVEDAAQAHGAEINGEKVGALGNIGIFSFFGNKIITTGEGGMLVTNDKKIYQKATVLRDHGMSPEKKYWHPYIGYNYRLTNIQAAIGVAQLENIQKIINRKIEISRIYNKYFKKAEAIITPPNNRWSKNVYWMYSMLIDTKKTRISRDNLLEKLSENNIDCRPFFYPIHEMPPYNNGLKLKNVQYLSKSGINLPSYYSLTDHDISKIIDLILKLVNKPCSSKRD